MLNLKTLTSE